MPCWLLQFNQDSSSGSTQGNQCEDEVQCENECRAILMIMFVSLVFCFILQISAASLGAQTQLLSSLAATPVIANTIPSVQGITGQILTNAQGQVSATRRQKHPLSLLTHEGHRMDPILIVSTNIFYIYLGLNHDS